MIKSQTLKRIPALAPVWKGVRREAQIKGGLAKIRAALNEGVTPSTVPEMGEWIRGSATVGMRYNRSSALTVILDTVEAEMKGLELGGPVKSARHSFIK